MKLNTGHPISIDKFCYQLIISSLEKPIPKSVEVRSDYTKEVPAGNPGYCGTTLAGKDVYSRSNTVFGVGLDYNF